MRIVVTGGHLTPALAIISQLRKLSPDIKIFFLGRKKAVEGDQALSFEYLEITKTGIPFYEITAGRLQRKLTKNFLISSVKFLPGIWQSFKLLKKIRPDIVLTFGGYLALPIAIAAKFLQIPVVAHEQSPNLGLANKIIFKFAKLVGVSQQELAEKLSDPKIIFTGPLLRDEIFKTKPKFAILTNFLEKVGNFRLIYVTGGATGSHFLNQVIGQLAPKILKFSFVIHQTGNLRENSDFKNLDRLRKRLPKTLQEKYFLTEFVDNYDVGAILSASDLVICRSGANTTAELQALGKVAIVIPLEWGTEQKEIAKNLEKIGSVVVILQNELTKERILITIKTIFENFEKFSRNAQKLKSQVLPNGAEIFAKAILKIRSPGSKH